MQNEAAHAAGRALPCADGGGGQSLDWRGNSTTHAFTFSTLLV
jgi:hypothetical protein